MKRPLPPDLQGMEGHPAAGTFRLRHPVPWQPPAAAVQAPPATVQAAPPSLPPPGAAQPPPGAAQPPPPPGLPPAGAGEPPPPPGAPLPDAMAHGGWLSWPMGTPGQWHEGVVPDIPEGIMGGGRFRVRRPINVTHPDLLVYLPGAGGSVKTQGRAQTHFLKCFVRAVSWSLKEIL